MNETAERTPRSVRTVKLRKNHIKLRLIVFVLLAMLLLLMAIFAEQLCPYDPYAQNTELALDPPSAAHPFGMDRFGRDLLSRVIMGSRSSIFSALALVASMSVIGTLVGVFCGYRGGWLDSVLMRISDVFLAFPGLVFALAVAGVLDGGIHNAVIALAAIGWPKFARLARSQTLTQLGTSYIAAARLSGSSTTKIVFKHILPNIAGPILVTAVLDIGTSLMELAGLSYLGLGAKPPLAEWGSMMSNGRSMLSSAPWTILAPGFAIFVTVAVFNLLGDTVRDYMDPRQRHR